MDPKNPGVVLDDNLANEEVNLSDDEKTALQQDTSKKFETVAAQKAHFREVARKEKEKRVQLEQENARLIAEAAAKTPPAPVTPPDPAAPPALQADAETAARKVAMELRRDEAILALPEDKRGSVTDFYNALTVGKNVDVTNISDFLGAAMRAAGVTPPTNSSNRIISNSNGNIPPREAPGPTAEQIDFARKVGNDPAQVYGDKADFSALDNAEKFVGKPNS